MAFIKIDDVENIELNQQDRSTYFSSSGDGSEADGSRWLQPVKKTLIQFQLAPLRRLICFKEWQRQMAPIGC